MSKIVKATCVICCLCLLVTVGAAPAYAAGSILPGCYDPADYIHDITISGDTKTIRYDFSDLSYAFRYWDNSGQMQDFTDRAFIAVNEDSSEIAIACYPFGVLPSAGSNLDNRGGALYVGDILPGSPIDFSALLNVKFDWVNNSDPFEIDVRYEPAYLLYDSNGVFLEDVHLEGTRVFYTFGQYLTLEDTQEISGTIPASSAYIIPYFRLRVYHPLLDYSWFYVEVTGMDTEFSVDLSTILDNSNQMQAIKDKLDDLNVSIGDVNDKLDEILNQPDQEKNDAQQGANDAFSGVVNVVPDHSQNLGDAFSGLASSMSYNGTEAKINIPAVSMPGIDGLFDGFIVMQSQTIDFEVYFDMLPDDLLLLVQSLFTAALIVFCFKELYDTIQYVLTLRG